LPGGSPSPRAIGCMPRFLRWPWPAGVGAQPRARSARNPLRRAPGGMLHRVVIPWYCWRIAVVPQPWRYQPSSTLPSVCWAWPWESGCRASCPRACDWWWFRAGAGLRAVHLGFVRRDAPHGESYRHSPHHRVAHRPLDQPALERRACVCARFHRLLVQRIQRRAQLSGGFDQGDLQPTMPGVRYQILAGPMAPWRATGCASTAATP